MWLSLASQTFAQSQAGGPVSSSPLQEHRLGRLLGMRVEDSDGQYLGRVINFVVDLQAGQVPFAVISSGGFLGIGARHRAASLASLSAATVKPNTLVLAILKAQWVKAPQLHGRDLAELKAPRRGPGRPPAGDPPSAAGPGGTSEAILRLASDVTNAAVMNHKQQNLGEISDLLVDLGNRKPAWAVLLTHQPSKPNQRFAVPLECLRAGLEAKVVLDADPARFEGAPLFDVARWTTARSAANLEIYRLSPAVWETLTAPRVTPTQGLSTRPPAPGSAVQDAVGVPDRFELTSTNTK